MREIVGEFHPVHEGLIKISKERLNHLTRRVRQIRSAEPGPRRATESLPSLKHVRAQGPEMIRGPIGAGPLDTFRARDRGSP